jgi:hypothetical protein
MTTTRALISTLLAVTVLATAVGGVARPARAGGAAQRMNAPATCPPDVARNSALGVALTLPPRWQEAAPGKFPPGELGLQIPAPPGRPDNDGRLDIASWGTTTDRDDARAAAAGMNRLLKGMKAPVTRVPVRYGGAPGVLVRGLPIPPAGVTAIVLAHAGAVYKILAPGKNLAPDQRQALASLRFIPRVGPFPPAVPPPPVVAAPPPPSLLLTVAGTGRSPVLRVRATGSGYRPGEAVELHACWTGSPRPGIRGVRYTWYARFAMAQANRAGSLDAMLTIPVSAQAYVSYTLRVLANDARIGNRLAITTIRISSTGPATPQAANWSISRVSPRASTADHARLRDWPGG